MRGAVLFACAALTIACDGHGTSNDPSSTTDPGAASSDTSAARSPVPPDGPCATQNGVATLLARLDLVELPTVDDHFVYFSDGKNIERVPVAGGAVEIVAPADPALMGMVVVDGALVYVTRSRTIGKIPLTDDDSQTSVTSAPFDGTSFYEIDDDAQHYSDALYRIPVDGTSVTSKPTGQIVAGARIAAGQDGVYFTSDAAFDWINVVPYAGAVHRLNQTQLDSIFALAVDDAYLYFSDSYQSTPSDGIGRIALDGTGLEMLTSPFSPTLAVDAHALYFTRGSSLVKMAKSGGPETKVGDTGLVAPEGILIHGGNVFVFGDSGGALSGPTYRGGIVTLCK
jgi:hypothetical protein